MFEPWAQIQLRQSARIRREVTIGRCRERPHRRARRDHCHRHRGSTRAVGADIPGTIGRRTSTVITTRVGVTGGTAVLRHARGRLATIARRRQCRSRGQRPLTIGSSTSPIKTGTFLNKAREGTASVGAVGGSCRRRPWSTRAARPGGTAPWPRPERGPVMCSLPWASSFRATGSGDRREDRAAPAADYTPRSGRVPRLPRRLRPVGAHRRAHRVPVHRAMAPIRPPTAFTARPRSTSSRPACRWHRRCRPRVPPTRTLPRSTRTRSAPGSRSFRSGRRARSGAGRSRRTTPAITAPTT